MQIRLATRTLRLRQPLRTAHGTTTERHSVEIAIADQGLVGHGEAAPLPGFGLESFDDALHSLQEWANDHHKFPTSPAARSAALAALDDLADAKTNKVKPPASVLVQALVGATDLEGMKEEIQAAVRHGYKGIKLKVGSTDPETDYRRICEAIELTHASTTLRLDANGGWSAEEAMSVLRPIESRFVDLVEEPTSNPSDWQKIADTTGLLLAADENLVNEKQVEGLLMNAAVGALILKPSILGGASGTRSIAELAAENKLRVIISSFLDGPIALRAARDLAIELAPKEIHGLGTAGLFVERFPKDVTPDQGYLHRS